MVQMNNRKMPTRGAARCYMALASILALLYGLQPTGLFLLPFSICTFTVGALSVPRASYIRVLLYSLAAGALPAALVAVLSKSPAYAVAAFAFAPAAALLVLTVRRRNSRSAGIFWSAAALTVVLVGAMLLWLRMRAGTLSFSVFRQLYTEVKTIFVDYLTPILQENSDAFFLTGVDPATIPAVLFDSMLSILPGVFLMLMWVIAWLATACVRRIFLGYVYGYDRFNIWQVTVWRPLSFVFLGCFLLSMLPIDHFVYTVIAIVCNNVYLVLFPIFTVVGCRKLKERLTHQPGCGCLFTAILVGIAVTVPFIPLLLLSVLGAFQTAFPPKQVPPPFRFDSRYSSDSDSDDDDPTDQGGASE